jgi:hypothetical protein
MNRLKQFRAMNQFKKAALRVCDFVSPFSNYTSDPRTTHLSFLFLTESVGQKKNKLKGHCWMLVGGRDQRAEGDVQEHGL